MGAKRKQRDENIIKQHRRKILTVLFRQKLQDIEFERLVRIDFIKEIKDGKNKDIHLQ